VELEDTEAVLAAPSAAVLIVYRADGTALTSPVWFAADRESVQLVIANGDPKLKRLHADARCVFMAFEITPPFRGVRIEDRAALSQVGVDDARLHISRRYLGDEAGRRYVKERETPGTVVRLPLAAAHSWNLRAILPTEAI
jgi:hypothetical protein